MVIFGWAKKETTNNSVDIVSGATEQTKNAIKEISNSRIRLENLVKQLHENATQQAVKGNKAEAMNLLRRKKLVSQELEKINTSYLLLEQQLLNLELAETQSVTLNALSNSVAAQKAIYQDLNKKGLDTIVDNIQEQTILNNEFSQVLAQGLPQWDDDELNEELNAIHANEIDKRVMAVMNCDTSSNIHTNYNVKNYDEDLIRQLEAQIK